MGCNFRDRSRHTHLIARLWRDKETRSVIIQIVTLVVNTHRRRAHPPQRRNHLEAVGKEFISTSFFTLPVTTLRFRRLFDYSSRSTHLQAAVVGLLNTLLVAACGIVLATVMGFTMGILRLSKNWLVNRLVYCFLEFTRNVPVLLHILLIHGARRHPLAGAQEGGGFR